MGKKNALYFQRHFVIKYAQYDCIAVIWLVLVLTVPQGLDSGEQAESEAVFCSEAGGDRFDNSSTVPRGGAEGGKCLGDIGEV